MKVHNVQQRTDDWHMLRKGVITGTGLKKVLGTKLVKDKYFYELLAEKLTIGIPDGESAMDRGTRLEEVAVQKFTEQTGKEVDLIGFVTMDGNDSIGSSPDGLIKNKKGIYTEAVECKCLSSANHLKTFIEQKIPEEYYEQGVQYFIVNPKLEKLHYCFYDDRLELAQFFIIEMTKKQVALDIEEYKEAQINFLKQIDEAMDRLITL